MYQLYYSPGACSMAVHVLLNETGAKFELKKVNTQAPREAEFLKVNPRGNVPVLVDDGKVIREGAAIIIHLLEKEKSPLLPASDPARATALEWLCYANASMHPAYGKVFFLMKSGAEKTAQDQLMKAAAEAINKMWADVDGQLSKNKYVCGNDITAADILLTVIANWGSYFPQYPVTLGSNVKRMIKEVVARPSYQKALASEQVEYKAAA